MKALIPWFWEHWKMPAREVEILTPRQADAYLQRWAERQRKR